MEILDGEKSYVLGLLVAGGEVSTSRFSILFPFDQWAVDPASQNEISTHILTKMRRTFKNSYGLDIDFSLGAKNKWTISPIGESALIQRGVDEIRSDLQLLRLPDLGSILDFADLSFAKETLSTTSAVRFLAGICDVRASLTKSHRNRVATTPIVSVEVPARTKNFTFVVQLCGWMTSIGGVTDQVLYNHPSIQSADNPDYMEWKKGFKIRIRASSFTKKLSFAISAKSFDAQDLASIEDSSVQEPCCSRKVKAGIRSIHSDINSKDLPESIRGQVFLHYHHICAVLGCPYAPIAEVQSMVNRYKEYISVFPICSKGDSNLIRSKYELLCGTHFQNSTVTSRTYSVKSLIGKLDDLGYVELRNGIAFLVATKIKGNRYLGNQALILEDSIDDLLELSQVNAQILGENAPIMISNLTNNRSIIVSSLNSSANARLIDSVVSVSGLEIKTK